MRVRVRARHIDVPQETRNAIERRVRMALGRHAPGIDLTQVTLSPSREGLPASRCRIWIRLCRGESFAIEHDAGDLGEAAASAAWRLEHRLSRQRANRVEGLVGRRRAAVVRENGS
ncbi:MAG: HPF/RaiA family ribosome-associated protein [Proteobacteria bacterium]|nr:HPF/RaiA family ribosome-associated protein [Pseudomonadota bacterium]